MSTLTAATACKGNDAGTGGIAGAEPPQPTANAQRPNIPAATAMTRMATPFANSLGCMARLACMA